MFNSLVETSKGEEGKERSGNVEDHAVRDSRR